MLLRRLFHSSRHLRHGLQTLTMTTTATAASSSPLSAPLLFRRLPTAHTSRLLSPRLLSTAGRDDDTNKPWAFTTESGDPDPFANEDTDAAATTGEVPLGSSAAVEDPWAKGFRAARGEEGRAAERRFLVAKKGARRRRNGVSGGGEFDFDKCREATREALRASQEEFFESLLSISGATSDADRAGEGSWALPGLQPWKEEGEGDVGIPPVSVFSSAEFLNAGSNRLCSSLDGNSDRLSWDSQTSAGGRRSRRNSSESLRSSWNKKLKVTRQHPFKLRTEVVAKVIGEVQRIFFHSCVEALYLAPLGIVDCLEELIPGPKTSYEVKFSHDSHTSIDGPKKGRIRAAEGAPKLFSGLYFCLSAYMNPDDREHIQELILAVEGQIMEGSNSRSLRENLDKNSVKPYFVYDGGAPREFTASSLVDLHKEIQEGIEYAGCGAQVISHLRVFDAIAAYDAQVLNHKDHFTPYMCA